MFYNDRLADFGVMGADVSYPGFSPSGEVIAFRTPEMAAEYQGIVGSAGQPAATVVSALLPSAAAPTGAPKTAGTDWTKFVTGLTASVGQVFQTKAQIDAAKVAARQPKITGPVYAPAQTNWLLIAGGVAVAAVLVVALTGKRK